MGVSRGFHRDGGMHKAPLAGGGSVLPRNVDKSLENEKEQGGRGSKQNLVDYD